MNEHLSTVRKMQDFIASHIHEHITLRDVASAVNYSPWYARKLFIKYLHLSPSEYIRRLKLSKSALKLRDEKCQIIDIAYEMGYGSVDGYQRAFRKVFGCNPKEYAKSPVPLWLFTPYLMNDQIKKEAMEMSNVRHVFIQLIEKPERKVILKRGVQAQEYFSYCEEVGCDVWGLLKSIKSISGEPVCMWLPEKLRNPITNSYVQGVEVDQDYQGEIPEGFDMITLPKSTYLLFRGEPFAEEAYAEAIGEIWEAIKKYDPRFIGYEWDDENPRIQLEPIGNRGYIELVPVRRVSH